MHLELFHIMAHLKFCQAVLALNNLKKSLKKESIEIKKSTISRSKMELKNCMHSCSADKEYQLKERTGSFIYSTRHGYYFLKIVKANLLTEKFLEEDFFCRKQCCTEQLKREQEKLSMNNWKSKSS